MVSKLKKTSLMDILIITLIIVGCILVVSFRISSYINGSDSCLDSYADVVADRPFQHTEHTHEHKGLACCPCGVCHMPTLEKHKHDDEDDSEDEEHEHQVREFALPIRLISACTVILLILSALHI